LTALKTLTVKDCRSLAVLKFEQGLPGLQQLDVTRCSELQQVEGLQHLAALKTLTLKSNWSLAALKFEQGLPGLQQLDVTSCTELQQVEGLHHLTALTTLSLTNCINLNVLQFQHGHGALQQLDLTGCGNLQEVGGLQNLCAVVSMSFKGCSSLRELQLETAHSAVTRLVLVGCVALQHCKGLKHLVEVLEFSPDLGVLWDCLQQLPPLAWKFTQCHRVNDTDLPVGDNGSSDATDLLVVSDGDVLDVPSDILLVSRVSIWGAACVADCGASTLQDIISLKKERFHPWQEASSSFYIHPHLRQHGSELTVNHLAVVEGLQQVMAVCLPQVAHLELLWCCTPTALELFGAARLTRLVIKGCDLLEEVDLQPQQSLLHLEIRQCSALRQLQGVSGQQLSRLTSLEVSRCQQLFQKLELKGFGELQSLTLAGTAATHLQIDSCENLQVGTHNILLHVALTHVLCANACRCTQPVRLAASL
jgi:hypothetical protein